MRRPGRSVRRAAFVAGAIVCAGVVLAELPPGRDDSAVPSRLASQTLLLDAAKAGHRIVAVGVRGHVVLSDDAGASWRQAQAVPTRTTLTSVFFSDDRLGWAVGHDAIVLHTADAGESWSLQHRDPDSGSPLFSIWLDGGGRGVTVGAYGFALETDDGGGHWSPLRVDWAGDDFHLNALFEARDGTLHLAAEGGHVYRSHDAGRTWLRGAADYPGSLWGGLELSSGRLLVFGMRGHMFFSRDGGEHWQGLERISSHSLGGGAELATGEVLVAGLGGSLLISRDGGQSFEASTRAERSGANAVLALPDRGALIFGEGGVQRLEPDGPEPVR